VLEDILKEANAFVYLHFGNFIFSFRHFLQ